MSESIEKLSKRIVKFCDAVLRSPLIWMLLVGILIFNFFHVSKQAARDILLWRYMITLLEPEHCALCTDDRIVRTYPCLVKLETGQTGQITVYDIGSEYLQEITQFREAGVYTTFSFLIDCGMSTTTEAHSSTSTFTLPENAKHVDPSLYCLDCRAKIGEAVDGAGITEVGYVLADMYDLEHIRIYPIIDGSEYEIQGYTVKVSRDKENKDLTVSVTGYFN